MRLCAQCSKEDRPTFDMVPCSCGAPVDTEDPSPLKHSPECNAVTHEVVLHPVRITKQDLTFDSKLQPKWTVKGWQLWQNGMKFYRVKMLCRACIVLDEGAQERRREYDKACKATRGGDAQTYAQMLASQ